MKIVFLIFFFIPILGFKFDHIKNPWATHQPVLYTMALKTNGFIIEFGCGDNSTEMLHEICKHSNRMLISIDDNFEWLHKFSNKYRGDGYEPDNSGWHKFYYVPGRKDDHNPDHWIKFLDNFEFLKTSDCELCFVDQSPWQARVETIMRVKKKIKYVILHDCDYFPRNNIIGTVVSAMKYNQPGVFDFSDVFKYFKVYFPLTPWPIITGPPTLLGSNFAGDLPEIDFKQFN